MLGQCSEDSDAVIVRLYGPHGDCGRAVLHTRFDLQRVAIANILEEELQEVPIKDAREVAISFTPFQVITLKISFATVS